MPVSRRSLGILDENLGILDEILIDNHHLFPVLLDQANSNGITLTERITPQHRMEEVEVIIVLDEFAKEVGMTNGEL